MGRMPEESSVRSRDDLTQEFSELEMQTAALRERHATMLREQAELSRTQSQARPLCMYLARDSLFSKLFDGDF